MTLEAERRPSGVWTVLYQPDIFSGTINKFQAMFDYLGCVLITNARFNIITSQNMACFQVTKALTEPMNNILGGDGFEVDRNPWLQFKEKLNYQSGQNVLSIREKGSNPTFSIIDPACHRYNISYADMPIAVGNHEFIERAMSELYSNATGQTVETELLFH